MRSVFAVALFLLVSFPALAQGVKPCEDLKGEIAKKLEAAGVKLYTLEIVAKDKVAEGKDAAQGKVVGSCDSGSKKIVYLRGAVKTAK